MQVRLFYSMHRMIWTSPKISSRFFGMVGWTFITGIQQVISSKEMGILPFLNISVMFFIWLL